MTPLRLRLDEDLSDGYGGTRFALAKFICNATRTKNDAFLHIWLSSRFVLALFVSNNFSSVQFKPKNRIPRQEFYA